MLTRRPAADPRRSHLQVGAIVLLMVMLLAVLALPLMTASPAAATTSGVQLSDDGVHFSSTYSGSLFESTAMMVPMSSQTARFWVKNATAEPAYLRVSLGGVGGGGTAFSGALTVAARTPSSSGSAVGIDAAAPCHVLTQGQVLAPGGTIRVDVTLALGDLDGASGQFSQVDFDILAGLSSAATGSMPPTTCLTNSGTLPGPPGDGGGDPDPGGNPNPGTPGDGTDVSGTADGTFDLVTLPDGSAFANGDGSVAILDSNTGRFFQEWFVGLWIVAAIAGGGLCLLVARRRLGIEEDEEVEVTGWLVDAPMSGRKAWSTTSGWA
jgi:hypothetical protein